MNFFSEVIDPDANYFSNLFDDLTSSQQSNYISINDFQQNFIKDHNANSFKIITYNIRSFRANSDTMFAMFEPDLYPDVIHLTETWFQEDTSENICGFTAHHTVRPTRRSGGSSIYVKDRFKSKFLPNLSFCNLQIEVCSVEISISNFSFIILGIYRPHGGTVPEFISSLNAILNDAYIQGKFCMIMGDLNIDILSESSLSNLFINNMYSHHFLPIVTKPTRFPSVENHNPSLLDHVWVNNLSHNFTCKIIMNDFTDHCPVFMSFFFKNYVSSKDDKIKISFRCCNSTNRNNFSAAVSNFDWSSIQTNDVNSYLEKFTRKVNDLYCEYFPLKSKFVSQNYFSKPWIGPQIKKLIAAKSSYFQLFKLGLISRSDNNKFNNKVKNVIEKSKSSYFKNYFHLNRDNLRKTWKMIRNLAFSNLSSKALKSIIWNGINYSTDADMADAFNKYFCSLPIELSESLETTNLNPLHFVKTNKLSNLHLFSVSPAELSKTILSLKNSKQNINEISVVLFKENIDIFSVVLSKIINLSFKSGVFPDLLKIAEIIPLFKKGDPFSIANFRPISLLPFISKIFEKSVHIRLTSFLLSSDILNPCQFGFLRGFSTEDAILKHVEHLYEILNSKLNALEIFIDFSKAFDTINFSILLAKLDLYGIKGMALKYFSSFLTDRKQCVRINGVTSSLMSVSQGVPQGSVLGPLLFLLYINEIPNISVNFHPVLFADDTTLTFTARNILDLTSLCNSELVIFLDWASANKLTVNASKTTFNIVSNIFNSAVHPTPPVYLNNSEIQLEQSIKYLGVFLDSRLKFIDHIDFTSRKLSKTAGILNRLKNIVPVSILKNLYYALAFPYLKYCNLIWGGTCPSHLQPLFLIQKKIIRIINKKSYLHPTSELFYNSCILKLEDIHKFELAVFMYKNHGLPIFHRNRHNYFTRNFESPSPLFQRLSLTQQSIFYRGPIVWNDLPVVVRSSPSLPSFKQNLKKHFLSFYMN